MNKIIILTLALLFSSIINSNAQVAKSRVNGVVADADSGEKLIGAIVMVSGTTMGGITDAKGEFSIGGLQIGKESTIEISYVGYKTKELKVKPTSDILKLIKTIELEIDGINVEEITVRGSAPVAELKGDTTIFNAGAYKTNPDATAGDLLAKMPGFEKNDDGTITSNGDKINRIYVDGKAFFKNDLETALSSLPAGLVESVEEFDDKSDKAKFTGFDDGSKIKSINIITKNKLGDKAATIAEASVGYGYDNVYMGSLSYLRMSDKQQLSVMGGSNNINITPVGMGHRYGGDDGGGIKTQTGVAINFTQVLKNEGEIGISYQYKNKKTDILSESVRTYFKTDSYDNRLYTSIDSSFNTSNSHNFSLDYKVNLGDKTQITFRPTGSLSESSNFSQSSNNSIIDGDTTSNSRNNTSSPSNYSLGGSLTIMRKFTENNFLTLDFNGNTSENNSDSYLVGLTEYDFSLENGEIPKVDEHQNQQSMNISNSSNISADLNYTQRVSSYSGLDFGYQFGYNKSDNDKRTYIWNEEKQEFIDLDDDLSNHFRQDYMTNNIGMQYNYKNEKTYFNVGAKFQNALTVNDKLYPEPLSSQEHSFNGAVIDAEFKYNVKENGSTLYISYSGDPRYPSVTQLQDVLNNDNPLQLSSGNPNLQQSYDNSIFMRYRIANVKKSIFLGVYSRISNTMNGVVNNTILFEEDTTISVGGRDYNVDKGAQYSSPINMNGNWDGRIGGHISLPINPIKMKLNLNLGYSYSKQPSMYNNEKYVTTSNGVNGGVGFNSNISENIDFSIRNQIRYSVSNNTQLIDKTKNTSFTNTLSIKGNWIVWEGFFLNADYKMIYRDYSNTPLDSPYTNMLNLAVGKKFSNDKFEIRASVYDALNQNISINQNVNDIYIAETISNNLQRYISVSFTYKFNSMKKDMKKYMKNMPKGMQGKGKGHGYRGRTTM